MLAFGSDEESVKDSFKCKSQYFMRNILIPRGIVSPALAWAPPPPGSC